MPRTAASDSVQCGVSFSAEAVQLFGVHQHLPRGVQLLVFPRADLCPGDFVTLEREQVDPCGLLALVELQGLQLRPERLDACERLANPGAVPLQARVFIEQTEMTVRIHQDLVLMLTMQFHKSVRELPQGSGRDQRAVDERTAAALRRDFAPKHHFHIAIMELCLHLRQILPGAHQFARRPAAKQKPDGLYQDGFSRTGFAGEDIQAGLELDLHLLNHREVSNSQIAQHEGGSGGGHGNKHRTLETPQLPL